MLRRIATTTLVVLAGMLVVACASALADDLPDAIDDPAPAVAPEPEPQLPTEPAEPSPDAGPAGADAADDNSIPTIAGDGDATASAAATGGAAGATAAASPSVPAGGMLPFTGTDDGRITWLLLVGSLLALAGLTSFAYARAAAELG